MIPITFYRLGAYFSKVLPRPVRRVIAWCIGQGYWSLRPDLRRTVSANLKTVHGDALRGKPLRARSRRVVMNFARSIQIFLELPFVPWEQWKSQCDFSELTRAVQEAGNPRSFVLATGHVGPWELGGFCLARLGYGLHTAAFEHPNARVAAFYSERRSILGVHAYPNSGSFPKLRAAIERGECVALLIDRAYGEAKKRFTLFGVESEFPIGHLVLALRCHVPVLTGALVFDGRDRFRYVHGNTHIAPTANDELAQLDALQAACLRDLESIIRAHSDQWFHFERIGRTEAHRA